MRKEINNEITKEIDEDTSEVKSSSVVEFRKVLNGFPLRRETIKSKRLVIPPHEKESKFKNRWVKNTKQVMSKTILKEEVVKNINQPQQTENKKIIIKFGSISESNKENQRQLCPTLNGYNTFLTIQNRLQKGWRNIPKHNKEWNDLMEYNFIPFLYFIDKIQCVSKYYKEEYENDGYEVEYDEKQIDKDVDDYWKRFLKNN